MSKDLEKQSWTDLDVGKRSLFVPLKSALHALSFGYGTFIYASIVYYSFIMRVATTILFYKLSTPFIGRLLVLNIRKLAVNYDLMEQS